MHAMRPDNLQRAETRQSSTIAQHYRHFIGQAAMKKENK